MLWQTSNFAGNSQHPDCRNQTSYQNLHHANKHGKCRRDRLLETKTGIYPMPVVKPKMKIGRPRHKTKLRYLGQYYHRNVKATARGKAVINYKRGRRVTLEGQERQARMENSKRGKKRRAQGAGKLIFKSPVTTRGTIASKIFGTYRERKQSQRHKNP